ncbi:recombinase family protein, partial [Yersinia rochesterensis]
MATIGYARVSTDEQSNAVQIEQLEALGCDKLFVENASGKNTERSQLKAMLDYVREGDTVVAMKVD